MYESLLPRRARPSYRLTRWKALLDERAGMLLARSYSPQSVGRRLCEWVDFVLDYEGDGAVLPSDVCSSEVVAYLDRRCSRRKTGHWQVRGALCLLLDRDGKIAVRPSSGRHPATALYEQHVPAYLAFTRQHRGLRSLRSVEWMLRDFFRWLAGRDIKSIEEVGQRELRDFISSRRHLKRSTVAQQASFLRGFVRYLAMSGVVPAALSTSIESPRLYAMSTPPLVLDGETVERLLAAVDRMTPLGKRDYAVLLLAARYGLRPSDIRGLRLDDIHWREQRITMMQAKSQRPLELPLVADVDKALVDYLRNGRPTCDVREVFVRHRAPIRPFTKRHPLWDVMQRALKAAGIELSAGQRGLYLLRHSAATRMLARGVPFDTISDVLGHASVETTRVYAQVDFRALRSVALSAGEVCR